MNVDNVVMELIVKSGEAKSQALEALAHTRAVAIMTKLKNPLPIPAKLADWLIKCRPL